MPNSSTFIVGNLGGDPELRFTISGQAVCQLNIAVSERFFDTGTKEWKDRDPNWYRVNCWRQLAENVAESLHSGDRVIVVGDMRQRVYEKDDEKRYTWELEARSVGPDLTFAISRTKKVERSSNKESAPPPEEEKKPAAKRSNAKSSRSKPAQKPDDTDPWDDEPPF